MKYEYVVKAFSGRHYIGEARYKFEASSDEEARIFIKTAGFKRGGTLQEVREVPLVGSSEESKSG